MNWQLKRTTQCAKCPWRKDVNPRDIPNGYCEIKHRALESTIAHDPLSSIFSPTHAMACHETHDAHCIGWLVNQIGPGNNIGLRMRMSSCQNARMIRTIGDQHEQFEDTLPQ
jgi:hypothetical protein